MSQTIIVTRNVSDRVRGFLASSLLELVPGVYCGARTTSAVRQRLWDVLEDWFPAERDASIVMLWREPSVPGEQAVRILGAPPVDLVEHEGVILTRRPAPLVGDGTLTTSG